MALPVHCLFIGLSHNFINLVVFSGNNMRPPAGLPKLLPIVLALEALFTAHLANAADFTISGSSTTAQTLSAGQTGVITSAGSLTLGGSTVPITVTGNSTITNSGQIIQTGTGRGILVNSGTLSLGITNNIGAIIRTADADALRITPTATSGAILDNYGSIISLNASQGGSQAVDWSNIISGSNVITNFSTGLIQAAEADAVRPGVNGVVNNSGTIKATSSTGSSSDGVDVQANTGVNVINAFNASGATAGTGLIEGARHGITGGPSTNITFITTVTNKLGGTIQGDNGSGINLYGFSGLQSATIVNDGTIVGNGVTGDGDGVDVDGLVNITNTGTIRSINAFSLPASGVAYSEGITVGGGTITNSGTIEGLVASGNTNAVGRGITLSGNDITTGPLIGTRESIYGNAIVTNQSGGLIRGQSDSGIVVEGPASVSGYTVTINNNSGATILGGGSSNAAIQVRYDNVPTNPDVTIINTGTIDGSSSGKAIELGKGSDTVKLLAGGSTGIVLGTVNGGDGVDTLYTGGTQTFAQGTVLNFEKFIVSDGTTTFNYGLGSVTQIQVDAGATLRINGAVSTTGDLTVNGTFKAPTGSDTRTITVAGNYAQGAVGVLEARVGPSGSDRITVTGTATLSNGATIRPVANGYIANGATFRLISAGTLSATPASLVVDRGSNFLTYQLQSVNNELVLVAQRANNFATVTTREVSGIATGLEGFLTSGAPGSANLLAALEGLQDAAALARATGRLAPEANGARRAMAGAAQGSLFSAFGNRMDGARSGEPIAMSRTGLSAGDAAGNRFWMEGLASSGSQGMRNGADGYKLDAQGIGFGYEKDLNVSDLIGLAVGDTQAGSDGRDNATGNDNRLKAAHLGGYFSRTLAGYTLDIGVAYSANRNSTRRLVTLPGFNELLQGSFSGQQLGAQLEYGVPFAVNSTWSGRWLIGARLGQLHNDGYTETGGTTAQRVEGQKANTAQSVLGAEWVNKLSQTSSYTLRARYLHEFANTPAINATFASGGPAFTVQGAQPARDSLQLGVGYRQVTAQGATLSFSYNAEIKEKFVGHQLSARAMWTF